LAERIGSHAEGGVHGAGIGVYGHIGSGEAGAEVGLVEARVGALAEDITDEAEAVLAVAHKHLIGGSGKCAPVGFALSGVGVAVEHFGGERSGACAESTGGHTGAGLLGGGPFLLRAEAAAEGEVAFGLALEFALDVGAIV
jgi:hypothetical protein